MVSAADPLGRNLDFLDRTSVVHSHKAHVYKFGKTSGYLITLSV
jgi:hypothetical protein